MNKNFYRSVNCFVSNEFLEQPFTSLSANLHQHADGPANRLAIFVHGWSGHGYRTWGDFPELLFEKARTSKTDVLLFDYKSGKRALLSRGADLSTQSLRLLRIVTEMSTVYGSISVITHSTGGLIAEHAVADYFSRPQGDPAGTNDSSINCLIHFAAPRAGTGLARVGLARLQREFRWLSRFSEKATEIQDFYTNYVQVDAVEYQGHFAYYLPRYAVIADGDSVVSRFSSTFGVSSNQVIPLAGSHGSITKPNRANPEAVEIALEKILRTEELQYEIKRKNYRAKLSNQPTVTREIITVEFWSVFNRPKMFSTYNELRRQLSTDRFTIQDVTEVSDLAANPVKLLISTSDADKVISRNNIELSKVERALSRRSESLQLFVGIAIFGEVAADAQTVVEELIADASVYSYLELATAISDFELEQLYVRWLEELVNRDPTRQAVQSRVERATELDETLEEKAMYRGYL